MHPEDAPGQCPKCGMNLVSVKPETKLEPKREHEAHDIIQHRNYVKSRRWRSADEFEYCCVSLNANLLRAKP
jgi:hypothetical protein